MNKQNLSSRARKYIAGQKNSDLVQVNPKSGIWAEVFPVNYELRFVRDCFIIYSGENGFNCSPNS